MNEKIEELKMIFPRLLFRKSSGKDGFLIVLASGIGDAILSVDYIEHMIAYCERSNISLRILCGSGARRFLVEDLKIPEKYFPKISVEMGKQSIYPVIEQYWNHEFDVVITAWNILAATMKSRKTFCWDSNEGYISRSKIWSMLTNVIYTKAYVLPQELWVGRCIQCMNTDIGIEAIKTRVPRLRDRLVHENLHLVPSENYAVISVDSSVVYRGWPDDCYIQSIREIHERYGYDIVLVGVKQNTYIAEKTRDLTYVIDMCGKTTYSELINLIAFSAFLLGVDSGNIHLAAALGVQAFALHGKYELSKYLPYDLDIVSPDYPAPICVMDPRKYECEACLQKLTLIQNKNAECYSSIAHNKYMCCMQNITEDMLMDAIETWYKGKAGTGRAT